MNITDLTGTAEALGQPQSAAGWLRSLAQSRVRYLVAAMTVYFVVIGALLVYSDFLPYVTDNNESFSMYFHARNILQFGVRPTAGLTDEANSSAAAAHPYVYTHEGNFPRIPVLVLMALGVNTVEHQITILALLVGGAGIYLCYRFFSRMAGDPFALLVVAALSTDYLLFTQWQVNTFRVWHGFFFFASLLCVQALTEENKRRIGALLFLNSIALFYFEIVFACFVGLFSVLYAAIHHWGRPVLAVRTGVLIAFGGLVALGTLLGQSFLHLGVERALEDIRLTFLARNFDTANGGGEHATRLKFFLDNHIVYWDSSFQPRGFLAIESLRASFSEGIVQVFTPLLILVMTIVTLPGLFNAWVSRRGRRFALGMLFVAGSYALLRWTPFDAAQITAWQGHIPYPFSSGVVQLLLAGALVLGFLLLSEGYDLQFGAVGHHHVSSVARYLLAGSAALAITNAAFPGYVGNGYLFRYAPLPVFTVDIWLALTLSVLLGLTLQNGRAALSGPKTPRRSGNPHSASGRRYSLKMAACSLVSAVLFGSILGYWVSLQATHFAMLPSTSILFMKRLVGQEFRGASFISDNYTLPIAYFTGQWAFQDQVVAQNAIVVTNDGPRLKISGKFMWFADRDTNAAYLSPQYYLCRVQSDLNSASQLASLPAGVRLETCSNQPLVRAARVSPDHSAHVLVASDPTPFDAWAIVQLDSKVPLLPKDLDNMRREPK